ncbi:MAG: Rrf2 family transcriptional regulator [Acidimicrobiia bacterium]|jgi:Rrf2 family protein|nr:Rrf2 family transcriptional regulator [Acidimicrobiia bacterium]
MKVRLGRRGDYAVRAMISIARHPVGKRRKTRQITDEMDLPEGYATQILASLARGGLLDATAGRDGGYSLARPAAEISVLDVVELAEGPITIDECVLRGGPCDWVRGCPIHATWSEAQQAFTARLAATSLFDLAALDAEIESGTHMATDSPHPDGVERRGVRDTPGAG